MHEPEDKPRSDADAELAREVRKERKFNMAEAIGRMAGPGAMKGASPVTLERQAEAAIQDWLTEHLADSEGALQVVLLRRVLASEILLKNLERPLVALGECCRKVLGS